MLEELNRLKLHFVEEFPKDLEEGASFYVCKPTFYLNTITGK